MICMSDHRGMFCFHAVSLCFGTAFPGTYFTFACVFIEPVCSHGLCSREEAVSVFSEDMHISEEGILAALTAGEVKRKFQMYYCDPPA